MPESPLIVRKEILVPATREEIWNCWTTKEGLESFFARKANVELRVGGAYECLFLLDNPPDLKGGEGCKVLSYFPMDYISFTWNAPPEFPNERDQHTKVVVEIDRANEREYKVALTHIGFGEGEGWQEVHAYFEDAWEYVLNNLRKRFEEQQ